MAGRLKILTSTSVSLAVFSTIRQSLPSTQLQATSVSGDSSGSSAVFWGGSIPIVKTLQGRKFH